jgi:hypothetical protein
VVSSSICAQNGRRRLVIWSLIVDNTSSISKIFVAVDSPLTICLIQKIIANM